MFRELEVFDVHNWVSFSLRTGDQRCSFDVIEHLFYPYVTLVYQKTLYKNFSNSSCIIIPLSVVCPVF